MTGSTTFYVERDDLDETELDVTYTFYAACRGKRDEYGVPLEPDEPAQLFIESVTVTATGEAFTLTEEERNRLEDHISEQLHECALGYED